ncbi:Hypothetical protein POVN_LOCUS660 [uncultured virus]|nr:Hypothetical protein POVN_LOCUS660 [uncultured virus]
MSAVPIYKWQIFCNVEQKFVVVYSETAPTTCPNDTAHEVNPESIQQNEQINTLALTVKDASPEDAPFQCTTFVIDIPAPAAVPTVITQEITFPHDTYMWEMSLSQSPSNTGDTLSVQIGPDTIIGATTGDVAVGAVVIPITATVLPILFRGSEIGITDGKATEYPGRVISIDAKELTITVETALTNAYTTGAYILWSSYPIRNLYCDYGTRISIGAKGLKSKTIPAGTTIRFIYTDNTPNTEATKAFFQIQYYHS